MEFTPALSDNQVIQIHQASLEVLGNVGFRVMHDEALRLFRKAGARIDEINGIVKIPRKLLEELISLAPPSYTIRGLDGIERTIGIDGEPKSVAIVIDPWIIDYHSQRPRRPRLEDVKRNTIIGQKLEHVIAMSLMDFPVYDVEGPQSNLYAMETYLLHHNKHYFVAPTSLEGLNRWLEVGQILTRGNNLKDSGLFTIAVASLTPLTMTELNVELMKVACENNFPVVPTICPSAGTTSPHSLAGTLVIGNVENLFMIALTQLFNPGHPYLYGFGPGITNMQSTCCMYYTLDKVLWKMAHVQMARFYDLPSIAECGGSMTYRFDQQNGAEGILFMMSAVASKADLIAGIGSTYNAVGHSTEMMVIQDAWLEAVKHLQRGIKIDDERLALESIKEVGPGGHYLTEELTLKTMRGGEFFMHELFDFSGEMSGGKSMLERAHEKVESMVLDFESPVPEDIQENIRRYFRKLYSQTYTNK